MTLLDYFRARCSIDATVGDLGEFSLIERLVDQAGPVINEYITIGSGDDAAEFIAKAPVLVSVDMLVEKRHFRRDWSSAVDVGRRAAAASLSDISAMGGKSLGLVVAFAAPGDLAAAWPVQCTAGLIQEAQAAGASIIGGDVTAAQEIVLSVTAFGVAPEGGAVKRSGAKAGNIVAVAGRLGWAAAGLALLMRGFRAPKAVVDAHRFPEVDYRWGPSAAAAGATAMIDVSDGLIADLRHVAEASGVRIELDVSALSPPEELVSVASAFNVDPLEWITSGGDDHAIVATFDAKTKLPRGFTRIGSVEEVEPGEESGVYVKGRMVTNRGGHEHFR
ncbi:MAG: hypothetical protein RJB01_27 [Actinomycetota bacterium]